MAATRELSERIKKMLVERLRLRIQPAEIADDMPLFGDGLGLDSIDVLEVVAGIEKEFGVAIQSQEEGERVLRSVGTIAGFLVERGVDSKSADSKGAGSKSAGPKGSS